MKVRRYVAFAAVGLVAAGVHTPAQAAKKAPVTKSYSMQLAPVPDPLPSGTSCKRGQLEGVSIHTETLKTTGPGTLKIMVSGFAGDWDITLLDAQRNEIAKGDGTSTGSVGAPATAGVDTLELAFKKADTYLIAMCNFAGSPQAKGTYTYTYK
jgi:hypothetical protein